MKKVFAAILSAALLLGALTGCGPKKASSGGSYASGGNSYYATGGNASAGNARR